MKRPRLSVLALCCLGLVHAETPARSEDGPNTNSPGRDERLRPLQEILDGTSMETISSAGRIKVELIAKPIYSYDDPARRFTDGAIWAWRQSGRPVALMTLTTQKRADGGYLRNCEMTSLATVPLSAFIPPDWTWEPKGRGPGRLPIPKAPAPAGDEARRLRQMKEQARRFRAFEYFAPSKQAAIERYELRLLSQPVLRYADPKSGLLDGTMFLMVYGTNPEVAILIEVGREGTSEPAWTYGLARMGYAELHATLDESEVWKQPRISRPSIRDAYTGFTRRVDPDR